jgi:hypothetical protein
MKIYMPKPREMLRQLFFLPFQYSINQYKPMEGVVLVFPKVLMLKEIVNTVAKLRLTEKMEFLHK